MPSKFLESLGGKLAEQWAANLFTPAFVFWMGGLAAWIQRFSWSKLQQWFTQLVEPLQVAVLVSSLLLIAASAFAVQKFDLTVLRLFEGYWPVWMFSLHRWLVKRKKRWFDRMEKRWQDLADKRNQEGLTAEELNEFVSIDWQLRQVPSDPKRLMPTKLGNLLRAAETRSSEKYGLDAIICWTRLWLVLPDTVKKELQEARADLNTAARVWLWAIFFFIWVIWAWWAIPIGFFAALFAHRWMLDTAATYGDLLESAFDIHRMQLYKSLCWPLPRNPAEEYELGIQLTEYLWRGSKGDKPEFVHPNEK